MVRSYVALVPLAQIGQVEDLRPIVDRLPKSLKPIDLLQPFEIELRATAALCSSERLLGACELLVDPERRGPVVVPDDGDWDELLCGLWSVLWPQARQSLTCRHAAGPEALGQGTAIAVTPRRCVPKWRGESIVLQEHGNASAVARAMLEHNLRGPEFELLESLPADPRILGVLHRSRTLIQRPPSDMSAIELRSLFDIVARAAPLNTDERLKARISDSLVAKLTNADPQEIFALANLNVPDGWPHSEKIHGAVRAWLKGRLLALDATRLGQFIGRLADQRYQAWWRNAIRLGLADAFEAASPETMAAHAWEWTRQRPVTITELDDVKCFTRADDEQLAKVAPNSISVDVGRELVRVSGRRGLPHLHALGVAVLFEPPEALERQAAFPNGGDGLRTLLSRFTGKQTVALACTGVMEAFPRAVDALRESPALLEDLDARSKQWRALLTKAVLSGVHPWNGLTRAKEVADGVVEYLLTNDHIDQDFVEAIAVDFPSVLQHPDRHRLWSRVREPVLQKMMRSTASECLAAIRRGETISMEPELQVLVSEIVVEELNARKLTDEGVATVLPALPAGTDHIIEAWIRNRSMVSLSTATGSRIGEAIQAALATEAARRVYEEYSRRGNWPLRAVLVDCRDLFPAHERWSVPSRYQLTHAEKHELFVQLRDIGCALYPGGPPVDLWEDTGGDAAWIPNAPTGAQNWQLAIENIERGHRKAPRAVRLIDRMLREFSHGQHGPTLQLMLRLLQES